MTESTIRKVLDNNARLDVAAATVPVDEDLYAAGMTSQASVNVMLALEEAFDFEFPPEMLTKTTFRSVANISEALRELGIDATQEPE